MAWEYLTVECGTTPVMLDKFSVLANEYGTVGWELVGWAGIDKTVGLNGFVAVFRRERGGWPAPPASVEPGWHADPFDRFEHRWWDGLRWSAQVASAGATSHDVPG